MVYIMPFYLRQSHDPYFNSSRYEILMSNQYLHHVSKEGEPGHRKWAMAAIMGNEDSNVDENRKHLIRRATASQCDISLKWHLRSNLLYHPCRMHVGGWMNLARLRRVSTIIQCSWEICVPSRTKGPPQPAEWSSNSLLGVILMQWIFSGRPHLHFKIFSLNIASRICLKGLLFLVSKPDSVV